MQRQVSDFFQTPMLAELKSGKDINNFVQRQENKKMRHISNICSRLMQYTYAAIFDIPEKTIEVQMPEPSNMYINSADDVKKIHESTSPTRSFSVTSWRFARVALSRDATAPTISTLDGVLHHKRLGLSTRTSLVASAHVHAHPCAVRHQFRIRSRLRSGVCVYY